jgi:hypothetical protein
VKRGRNIHFILEFRDWNLGFICNLALVIWKLFFSLFIRLLVCLCGRAVTNLKLSGKINPEDRARARFAGDLNVSSVRPDNGFDKTQSQPKSSL